MSMYRRHVFYEVVQWHSKDRYEIRWVTAPCPGEIQTGRSKTVETKEVDWGYYDKKRQLEDVPAAFSPIPPMGVEVTAAECEVIRHFVPIPPVV